LYRGKMPELTKLSEADWPHNAAQKYHLKKTP